MTAHNIMARPVFRFAPSPNGYLHLGHALSACLNFTMAQRAGGRFLLRIEDIDVARCKPEFESAIYEDLAWLGLTWERPVRRQSQHFGAYRAAVARLDALGLVYPSFESRGESPALCRSANVPRRGRATRTRRRCIPATRWRSAPPSALGALRRESLMLCGSIWRRLWP